MSQGSDQDAVLCSDGGMPDAWWQHHTIAGVQDCGVQKGFGFAMVAEEPTEAVMKLDGTVALVIDAEGRVEDDFLANE